MCHDVLLLWELEELLCFGLLDCGLTISGEQIAILMQVKLLIPETKKSRFGQKFHELLRFGFVWQSCILYLKINSKMGSHGCG